MRRDFAARLVPFRWIDDVPSLTSAPKCDAPTPQQVLVSQLRYLLLVAAFNFVIAVILWLVLPSIGTFVSILIYSECIGTSIFALHLGASLLPLPGSPGVRETERIVIATPLGLGFGSFVAATLVGDPASPFMMLRAPRFEIITTIIASAVMVYFLWTRQRLIEEANARARASQLAAEAQLRLLHSQLEPHMLFNTLANLRILVEADPARAQTMIDQLIAYLRATLAASRVDTVTLDAEFEQLTAYLELMRVRMGERLAYHLDASVAARGQQVPPMLLQPLVENAIKHGLEPAIDGGEIRVSATIEKAQLVLVVEDSGLGAASDVHDGYGLAQGRARLAVLYGPRATLAVTAVAPHGFRVQIGIPLKEQPR